MVHSSARTSPPRAAVTALAGAAATALLAVLAAAAPALAYPIAPRTLWDLSRDATLIVYADVRSVRELDGRTDSDWNDSVARLVVLETWKGEGAGVIDVPYSARMICPAPPRYVEGQRVVAFLEREQDAWSTVALSYGTLYPRPDELATVRERVKEAARLQAAGAAKRAQRVAWAARAAAHPATRWDGLFELLPDADALHSYYDRGSHSAASNGLRPAQLRLIAAGFVERPEIDRTFPMLLALLRDYPDPGVDRVAGGAIELLLAQDEPPWWTREAFALVLARFGDPLLAAHLALLGDEFAQPDAALLRTVWQEVRSDLALPEFPMVGRRKPVVWGVGANTPD